MQALTVILLALVVGVVGVGAWVTWYVHHLAKLIESRLDDPTISDAEREWLGYLKVNLP